MRCEISRAAKRARPDLPVVWGGWHPSMFARECLAEPGRRCHGARAGRGDLRGDRRAPGGRATPWRDAPAAPCACADGSIHENPPRPLASIDKFRAHDYGLIPVERYYELKGKRQLDYISSQGCNFRCAFCSDPFVYGRKWVGLEPDAHGAAAEGALGPLSLRRRQFPGRDLLHAPRSRAGLRPSTSSTQASKITLGGDHARRPGRAPARGGVGAVQALGAAAPAGRRRVGLERDAQAHPQGHQDRAGVRYRRAHAAARHRRPLSLHRRLPRGERRQHSVDARLRASVCAR